MDLSVFRTDLQTERKQVAWVPQMVVLDQNQSQFSDFMFAGPLQAGDGTADRVTGHGVSCAPVTDHHSKVKNKPTVLPNQYL